MSHQICRDVRSLVHQHDPQRSGAIVDRLLQTYDGREEELLSMLRRCYLPHSEDGGRDGVHLRESYRRRVARYYRRYAPDKVAQVDAVLDAFAGEEERAILALVEKYGKPEPVVDRSDDVSAIGENVEKEGHVQRALTFHDDEAGPVGQNTNSLPQVITTSLSQKRLKDFARAIFTQHAYIQSLELEMETLRGRGEASGRTSLCAKGSAVSDIVAGLRPDILEDAVKMVLPSQGDDASALFGNSNPRAISVWVQITPSPQNTDKAKYKQRVLSVAETSDGATSISSKCLCFAGVPPRKGNADNVVNATPLPQRRSATCYLDIATVWNVSSVSRLWRDQCLSFTTRSSTSSSLRRQNGTSLLSERVSFEGQCDVNIVFDNAFDRALWYVWLMRWAGRAATTTVN